MGWFLVSEEPTSCRATKLHGPQLLSPYTVTTEAPVPGGLCLARREASTMRSWYSVTGEQPRLTTTREKPTQQKRPSASKKKRRRTWSQISNTYIHFFTSLNKCPLSAYAPDPAKVFPSCKSRWASLLGGRSSGNAPSRVEVLQLWPSEKAATTQEKERILHFLIEATFNDFVTGEVADGLCQPPAFHYFLHCPVLLLIIRIAYIYVDLKWL